MLTSFGNLIEIDFLTFNMVQKLKKNEDGSPLLKLSVYCEKDGTWNTQTRPELDL